MDDKFKIEPKDGSRQFYFKMSTPTYHILIENLVNVGEDLGMVVKRNDEDVNREMVKTQFTLSIKTTDGASTPISLTGYHTNNSMLIQLLGNKTEKKVGYLGHFVNNILVDIISKVERSDEHRRVKEMLREHYRQVQNGLEDGCNPGITSKVDTVLVHDDQNKVRKRKIDMYQNREQDAEVDDNDADKEPVKDANDVESVEKLVEQENKLLNQLRIRLDEETKEKKKALNENEGLKRKMKELLGKEKVADQLKEKLEKITKLKDQTCATVQTLKQNEVLEAQQKIHSATISSKDDTLLSYAAIIENSKVKIQEKDSYISQLLEDLKEKNVGIETHKEIAYQFMNQLGGGNDGEVEEERNNPDKDNELAKLYNSLRAEEEKCKASQQEISLLKKEIEEMNERAKEVEETTKSKHENMLKKINEKENEYEKIQKVSKKEEKQLKEALGASEKCVAELNQKVKMMEDQVAINLQREQVKNAGKVNIGTNTPVNREDSHDKSQQTTDLTEHGEQEIDENINNSLSDMKNIVMDKQLLRK